MIAEAGHYALVLALGLALIQSTVPILGARWRDPALMNVARSTALAQLLFVAVSFAALVTLHVTSDFSVVNVFENSHSLKPLIYKITGVWGNHEGSMLLWVLILALFGGAGRGFRQQSAAVAARPCAGGAGLDRQRVLSVHPDHLEPVPAHCRSADRGPRPQSGAAGHRPRGASADALSRLCRLLDLVLLRRRGPDRRPDRRGLGALGAAVDAGGLDVPHARHRDGLVLGLLRTRLGRLVVLGSGRERLADAVARRHRAAAFRGGDGEAQRAEGLDHPAGDPDLLAVAARHVPGALGRAHLGACVRDRSDARRVHPADPLHLHRRQPVAVCLARARR